MSDELLVLLEGLLAARIVRAPGQQLTLTYEPAYRALRAPTPLSLAMPVELETHAHAVVSPWLWGLLPDNDDVIARWAREYQVSRQSVFSLLSTPIGHDCAGAVQFATPETVDSLMARRGTIDWLTEHEVADRLRGLEQDRTAWHGRRSTPGRFSLAGAQAKTALRFDGQRWGEPSGSEPTSHILKPAVPGFEDQDLNEFLCLAAAKVADLRVAQTSIHWFEDVSAIVSTRYDRREDGNELRRVHQEDMCQSLSVMPVDKYENEGGPGAVRILQHMRRTLSPAEAAGAADRFVDALIWNWLIGGTDAHAKNYSFLLSGRQVRLAPLYDVATALPYYDEHELKVAMRVGNDYRMWMWSNPWPKAAKMLGYDPDALQARVVELAHLVEPSFVAAAAREDARRFTGDLAERIVELTADRARHALRMLGTSTT